MEPINLKNLERGTGKDFLRELANVPRNLNGSNIKQFYSTVIELFKKKDTPEPSMSRLIVALCKTVSVSGFIEPFVKHNFAVDLPYGNSALQEQLLNLFCVIVSHAPSAFNATVATKFCRMIKSQPRKCLTVIAILCKQFDQVVDPWPVVDILFKESAHFRNSECAEDYASLLVYLCQEFEDFRDSRLQHCWTAICEALSNENVPSLITLYYSLCQLYEVDADRVSQFQFPTAAVAIHLKKPAVVRAVISLLLRITPKHRTSGVVQGLLAAAHFDVNANLVLVKMATKKSVSKTLIHDATWMTCDLPTKVDTMRLFAVVLSHVDLRPDIASKPEVVDFLKNVTTLDSSGVLTAVCTFVRRLGVTEEYALQLSKSEFLAQYFATATQHTDETTIHSTLLMIDTIAKACYVREFSNVCDYVSNLVKDKNEAISQTACKVAIELARYPKCAQRFQQAKLDDYFTRKQKDPKMKKVAVHFLKAYGKALDESISGLASASVSGAPSAITTPKQPKDAMIDVRNDSFSSESERGNEMKSSSSSSSSDDEDESPIHSPKIDSLPNTNKTKQPVVPAALENPPPPSQVE
ncbi:hypothetical protein TRFO_19526 [Tritrichomonas foetus]|uniref:Uncharacterized protein n=1 Tax=Tritrichomonas foetus TaxID=1144522 RepID=A0A1J4KIP7_9EUKA|nr:hypothetical protein TRFO_19526 [Tritrichomonas foetus]|eukprot:OHT10954.1 hypothetical protein TRFO_19526 [Tritrichomonas foetus]